MKKPKETCKECLILCPEHGNTYCLTCHVHPGECDCGGCEQPGRNSFVRVADGNVIERRMFCDHHATSPEYAWLRAGLVWEKK